jgi:hypothetical protein
MLQPSHPLPKLDYNNMGITTRMQGISRHKLRLDPAAGNNWQRNDHGSIDGINTREQKRFGSD